MSKKLEIGLVVRVTGGDVWVDVDGVTVTTQMRGKLRAHDPGVQIVAGDRVAVSLSRDATGGSTIEEIHPRDSWLSRWVPRESTERMIVANVERLFVVASVKSPPIHPGFIDRVLIAAERGHVKASLIINKTDLDRDELVEEHATVYERCGYDVIRTSAETGEGMDSLRSHLGEGVYAFVGESGVGKSSLLMKLDPKLDLKVREIGPRTNRGRHTTTFSQLYPFGDGYLADTPGVQTFGFAGADPGELADCFPEFADREVCRFNPCTHSHEPDCGVKMAVDSGDISGERYQSYCNILEDVIKRQKRKSW